jgi:hypothetical protein
MAATSIFLDVTPLTPATGCYFAALLAVALFVKFSRLLSVRNWDVLTLFLPAPGLLLLIESGGRSRWGYLALLLASLYFLLRCLVDLALVRRPVLSPNLTPGGLFWLAGALFVGLLPARPLGLPAEEKPPPTPPDELVRDPVKSVISKQVPTEDRDEVGLWVERGLALACHLSIVVALVLVGRLHFDDVHAGAAAAACYLLLPYVHLLMPATGLPSARWDHAWPMAWMIWAVVTYRRPGLAGVFLGLAAGTAFFPVLIVPAWIGFYHRRGLTRFLVCFGLAAGVCLGVLGLLVWAHGELPPSLRSAWAASNWLPWKAPLPETPGVWQGLHWAYRLPIFLAFLAFVVATLFWPNPKDLAQVLALSAAVLIGIQFWYADAGGVYLLWYLPFLLLLVFRPNLSACRPPPPPTDDWAARLGRALHRRLRRLLRLPDRPAPVT